MNKLLLVFDYFKETFRLNKQNKSLYTPQIALIAITVLMVVTMGVGVYSWIGVENINNLASMQPQEILKFGLNQGLKLIAILLVYSIISVIVEAGLLNMYKSVVTQGYTESGDFKQGVTKYFLKLLLGEVLIVLCYILAIPFYLIIGLLTLTVGLTVIPLAAAIFLTMWKVSLVMNDKGIFGAIKDSFSFAKRNFIPLAFLQIIHWAFTQGVSGGSGSGSNNINLPDNVGNLTNNPFFGQPGVQNGLEQVVEILKIVILILIPVVALATIGASIIAMIFEVFFSLALFVAYKNDFKIEEKLSEIVEATELEEIPQEAEEALVEYNQIEEVNLDNEEVEQ